MKIKTISATVMTIALLAGCATERHRGPAYGHEQEFRQQIAESVPVKAWGYSVHDIRFSDDYHKALIVFVTPSKAHKDMILSDDGFHRFTGSIIDTDRQKTAQSSDTSAWSGFITVTLPSR